jgi:hypothetical protein
MSTLSAAIQSLAETFASQVLSSIRGASLEDILAESGVRRGPGRPPGKRGPGRPSGRQVPGRPPGPTSKRLGRRSAKDLAKTASAIVALVKQRQGLRAEQIRAELRIPKNAWARPLAMALDSKKLTKKGQKRATTYYAR